MSETLADFGRVALVLGGKSSEAEVSRRGGADVYRALQAAGVEVEVVDGISALRDALCAGRVDRVFNLVHGEGGEDGVIQGLLAAHRIPCTGTGLVGAVTTMNKLIAKSIWQTAGLPTPPWIAYQVGMTAPGIVEKLGRDLVVKPVDEGSSVAVELVHDAEQLHEALISVGECCDALMVEQQIIGSEMTAGILGDLSLPLVRIEPRTGFYDYQAKYESGDTRYICPAGLADAEEQGLRKLAREAYDLCGVSGWGRVDIMLDETGAPWLLEVNTTPGMTSQSLIPKAAEQSGMDFRQLVIRILTLAEVPS